MPDSQIVQLITLAIAVIGAVLGVLNTWRAFSLDRVRLIVKPAHLVMGDGTYTLGLEITNLSNFDLTITHTGFTLRATKHHMQFLPIFQGGDVLPVVLKPRTRQTAILRPGAEKEPNIVNIERAYVKTACGHTVKVGGPVLQNFVNEVTLARLKKASKFDK